MDVQSLRDFLDNPTDGKRVAELQKQFAAIWHANKCIKANSTDRCTLPICPHWRSVLEHYSTCNDGLSCQFQSCATSRVLIDHYNSCTNSECKFCGALRRCSKKTSTIVCTQIQHCTAGPSTSEFAASLTKGFCSDRTTWNESACTAKAAYFSTYNRDYINEESDTSFNFMPSSYIRTPYGKKESIQRELIVMFHVQKCSELDQNDPMRQQSILCAVPHCSKMKRTLIHVAMCQGEQCNFPACEVTRTIIQHWLRCPKHHCDICVPVLDSIPALDGGSHYEMDDKLLALLYTSPKGLIDLSSSDLLTFEKSWTANGDLCYDSTDSPRTTQTKRKFSNGRVSVMSPQDSPTDYWDKKRRIN